MQETSEETAQEPVSTSPKKQESLKTTANNETVDSATESPLRRPGESQVAYLQRAGELVTHFLQGTRGKLLDPNRLHETDLTPAETTFIESLIAEARRRPENETEVATDPELALISINMSIGSHTFSVWADNGREQTQSVFERTTRNRKLFEIQPGKNFHQRETYWNTLFFPYNTTATRELAKDLLQSKTIVLLGGGRARLTEEMKQNDITPRAVLNVDPFVNNPELGSDPVLPISAADKNFINAMRERGINSADEILAEYSVPAYLEDPAAIKQLFENIDTLLAPNGTARIWPIEVLGRGTETDVLNRKAALMESLTALASSGNYEIVPYKAAGRAGFTLHKISKQA